MWWHGKPAATQPAAGPIEGVQRGRVDHVIILDGTMSTLAQGQEGNAGLLYQLLTEQGRKTDMTVYYEQGLQWEGWRHGMDIVLGRGINRQIRRAYGWLASHYREGDRIFLFGYSRGGYAVRSLAGVIDRVGLLKREHATERGVRLCYRHYQNNPESTSSRAFSRRFCHADAPVQMVGAWDTVKALGLRLPFFWMLGGQHDFHSHQLGRSIKHGFHALAINETRVAFAPVLWECPKGCEITVEQVWFRGAHADIGGNIGDFAAARPLANIPLVWMLGRAETVGLSLPRGWQARYPCDPMAPMVGTVRGFGLFFLLRRKRLIGLDPSESIHPSAAVPRGYRWRKWPLICRL
ncbi:MAG: DUF2235 domain-containing protein [Cypionkella sp.]